MVCIRTWTARWWEWGGGGVMRKEPQEELELDFVRVHVGG